MKYLIDTQILIWAIVDPHKLSAKTISILQEHTIMVSQISLFEIAIKKKVNKLPELYISVAELIERMRQDNFQILRLEGGHISSYDKVPLVPDHRDPFDRLIIATALSENIPLISADEKFLAYQTIIDVIENR